MQSVELLRKKIAKFTVYLQLYSDDARPHQEERIFGYQTSSDFSQTFVCSRASFASNQSSE